MRRAVARHAEAQRERLAGGGAAVALLARTARACPELKSQVPCAPDFSLLGGLRGREIAVGQAVWKMASAIWRCSARRSDWLVLLVPAEVEPAQALEDGIERGFGVALDVGIVDAQDHGAAVVAGVEPVEDEGARAADVQKASGGRRKANS